jgi:hypothetical protein
MLKVCCVCLLKTFSSIMASTNHVVSNESIRDYVCIFELFVLSDTPKMCLCSCHVSGFQQSYWDVHCDTHIKLLGLKYIIIKMCNFPGMYMGFIDAIF